MFTFLVRKIVIVYLDDIEEWNEQSCGEKGIF